MVDTIVLRVHDLKYHYRLIEIVNRDFNDKYSNKEVEVPKEEFRDLTSKAFANDTMILNYFTTKNKTRIRYSSREKINNSGNYLLNAYVNRDRDFIEFSFSVPKYIFGTNVLLFTEHNWDKNFVYWRNKMLKYNLNSSYKWLSRFIKQFFITEFPDKPPLDFQKVEIDRIDLCYNQVFNNKAQAFEFLEFQKKFQRKHMRSDSNRYREYDTSFMYITKRYSIKVYHKGTEYAKKDSKENKKINNSTINNVFNISELQKLADCTLRYEISFRSSMLSYLYNQYIFRSKCPTHTTFMKIYRSVESIMAKNDRIAERLRNLKTERAREKYSAKHPFEKVKREDKGIHKYLSKIINMKRSFMLAIDPGVNLQNQITGRYSHFEPRALFSKPLFDLCSKFLFDFIKEFQVKDKPPLSVVEDLIKKHNKAYPEDQLPFNEMKKFYMLLQDKTFDEIKKARIYSKATFYRYVKRFEKIGVTKNNIVPTSMISVDMDLGAYHQHIMMAPPFFTKKVPFHFH